MSALIRPATLDDVASILRIYNAAVVATTATWDHEPVTLEDRLARYEAAQANGWAMLVAEADGRVIGFGAWSPFRAKVGWSKTMEHSVYVDAAARGSGTGRALLRALVETARASGVHTLIGVVGSENEVSLRLHERLGFVEAARLPQAGFKFGRWLDAVFVQLTLDSAPTP